jgi:hypothetical protein
MPKNIVTSLGKSASAVISVEEVFDDGYQPSSDGKLLQIYIVFIVVIKLHHVKKFI